MYIAKDTKRRALCAVFVDAEEILYAMTFQGLKATIAANSSAGVFLPDKSYNNQLMLAWKAIKNPGTWDSLPECSLKK